MSASPAAPRKGVTVFKTAPDEHVVSVEHITHVEDEDDGTEGEGGEWRRSAEGEAWCRR